ncbi:hypothetical protein D1159_04400 [Pseudoflavonifractor sp. 524-17]|uniref:hypothetical protein n=1 Tax=Pseudoflavonifractor sp. 524-17 TaxID=2304577 RepID=UPI00137B00FE|nr:hypothetical protein [Pseudoflavonifractor sp. 524-17]NCE63840.1 hypothetical protein [Pseudoflavonifractor sp. 524-17]
MSDSKKTANVPQEEEVTITPYRPASPEKRALAWMGVVYMIILVLLSTYYLATGHALNNIPGILFFPACGGLAAVSWFRFRTTGKLPFLPLAIASALACIVSLILGSIALGAALVGG